MPLEQADLTQITEILNTAINGFAARQKKELDTRFTTIMTDVEGRITAVVKPTEQQTTQTTPTTQTAPAPDPKVAVLERTVAEMKTQNEKAQAAVKAANRQSALDKALSTFTFANEDARSTAFNAFSAQVVESADGTYVIGDQPMDVAVKAKMTNLTGLLAPKDVRGSGAAPGTGVDSAITEESIKPGMSKDDAAKVGALLAGYWSPGPKA